MFGKIFEQIYDSSVAERYLTRYIFMDLIVLGWPKGIIDMPPAAISRRINVPVEVVLNAINELEQPDPISRTKRNQGARLVRLLDAEGNPRSWGWKIVNYDLYKNLRSKEQQKQRVRDPDYWVKRRLRLKAEAEKRARENAEQNAQERTGRTSNAQDAQTAPQRTNGAEPVARETQPRRTTPHHRAPASKSESKSKFFVVHTQGAPLSMEQARKALTDFSRKHFVRVPSVDQWHNCFDSHLQEAMPITQGDLDTLDWFYGLTQDYIEELKTGRRREFANVMAYLSGEIQKAYAASKQLKTDAVPREKKDPANWREFLQAKYGADVRLPEHFEELDSDLRAEYEAGIDKFNRERAA